MITTATNGEKAFPADEWATVDEGVVVVVAVGVAGEVVAAPEDGVADDEVGGAVVFPDSTVTASFIPLPQCPITPHMK